MAVRTSRQKSPPPSEARLSIRIDLATGGRIGPGKVALLEAIDRAGSISAAGRDLRMSYRRAWELVEELNKIIGSPVVNTSAGGSGGGGATLTPAGEALVTEYRAIEEATQAAARRYLEALGRTCTTPGTTPAKTPAKTPA
ncbi:MAG: LysR family transcriptional regulator [Paludibaculum sp.]